MKSIILAIIIAVAGVSGFVMLTTMQAQAGNDAPSK